MKNLCKVILMTFAATLLLFYYHSVDVSASESDDWGKDTGGGTKGYTYHINILKNQYDLNGIFDKSYNDSYTFLSDFPLKIMLFVWDNGNSTVLGNGTTYRLVVTPEDINIRDSIYLKQILSDYANTYEDFKIKTVGSKIPYYILETYNSPQQIGRTYYTYHFDIPCMRISGNDEFEEIMGQLAAGNDDAFKPNENLPPVDIEKDGIYLEEIPVPNIKVLGDDGAFVITNAVDEYYIEIQGRWWSVDDIELSKEGLTWYYTYYTDLKTSLSTWVSYNDHVSSSVPQNLITIGESSAKELLALYPVDERNIYGGTNAVGNFFSGYEMARAKMEIWLETMTSPYFTPELYIRFYYVADGQLYYGRWCHWFKNLADYDSKEGNFKDWWEQSEDGLTPSQKDSLEKGGHSNAVDTDTRPDGSYDSASSGSLNNAVGSFLDILEGMMGSVGRVIPLASTFFSWLPWWVSAAIGGAIVVIIVLRIAGR